MEDSSGWTNFFGRKFCWMRRFLQTKDADLQQLLHHLELLSTKPTSIENCSKSHHLKALKWKGKLLAKWHPCFFFKQRKNSPPKTKKTTGYLKRQTISKEKYRGSICWFFGESTSGKINRHHSNLRRGDAFTTHWARYIGIHFRSCFLQSWRKPQRNDWKKTCLGCGFFSSILKILKHACQNWIISNYFPK